VVDDLPVLGRHEVLGREERLAVEDADPPVELGGDELLQHEQVRDLEQRVELRLQLVGGRRP
jgi:hypothetical protein